MRKNKKNTAGSRLLLILRYALAVTAACLAAGPVVFLITGSLMGRGGTRRASGPGAVRNGRVCDLAASSDVPDASEYR